MDALKNASIIILLLVLLIVLPVTVYLGKSYFTLSAQVEQNQNNKLLLQEAALNNNTMLSQKLDLIGKTFMNNHYLLNNQTPLTKIDIKTICEQNNGISCIYEKNGNLEYLGNYERF